MSEPLKLVVVEDHALFRRGLIGLLNDQSDFRVVGEAGNGPDSIELCRQQQPDVVVMDVHMPGGNGIEAVQTIKQELQTRILMLTISTKDEDLIGALAAGADGYLLKNTEPAELCEAIRHAAAGHGVLSPEITLKVMQVAGSSRAQKTDVKLSPREREVVVYLARGLTATEIADALFISKNTVKTHIRRILKKLNVSNRAEAVAHASALGLIPPRDE